MDINLQRFAEALPRRKVVNRNHDLFQNIQVPNPIEFARSEFLAALHERPEEKQAFQQKTNELFDALKRRSIFGEGFSDPIFSELALLMADHLKANSEASKIFFVTGDFTNARGARKFLEAQHKQRGDYGGDEYEISENSLSEQNRLFRAQAQFMRQEILKFGAQHGIQEDRITFLDKTGDELGVLISTDQNLGDELNTFLCELNTKLKAQTKDWGFAEIQHAKKEKLEQQSGFGLSLAAAEYDATKIDELIKALEVTKSQLYKKDTTQATLPDGEKALATIADFAKEESKSKSQASRILAELFEMSQGSEFLEGLCLCLDKLIRLPNPLTGTLKSWNLEEEYTRSLDLCSQNSISMHPKLARISGSSIAGLNNIHKKLGDGFIKTVVDIVREKLRHRGYAEDMINNLIFHDSAAFMWVLLTPYKDNQVKIQFTEQEFQELERDFGSDVQAAILEINSKPLKDLVNELNRLYQLMIELPEASTGISVGEIENPKDYSGVAVRGLNPKCRVTTISSDIKNAKAQLMQK